MRTGTLFGVLVVAACSTQSSQPSPAVDASPSLAPASSIVGERLVSEPPRPPEALSFDPTLRDPFQPGPALAPPPRAAGRSARPACAAAPSGRVDLTPSLSPTT